MGQNPFEGLGSFPGIEPVTRKPRLATAADQSRTSPVLYERAPR
jgi:hypothetical protein